MPKKFDTPILLIGFNRPELTRKALNSIREVRPKKLYFAVDGARNKSDENKVEGVKSVISQVDWPCEVKKNFQTVNCGCKEGPVRAMNWFFKNEEMGIILEDDVLADESFFYFADELLKKYKDDSRVGSISGNNFQFGRRRGKADYYFSRYSHSCGWATWRRAWEKYDPEIHSWPKLKKAGFLKKIFDKKLDQFYWQLIFDGVYSHKIESAWDYQWNLSMWSNNMLGIIPNRNLVSNIGFGSQDATHTKHKDKFSEMKVFPMTFPLHHPTKIIRDLQADDLTQKQNYVLWKELGMIFIRKVVFVKEKILGFVDRLNTP